MSERDMLGFDARERGLIDAAAPKLPFERGAHRCRFCLAVHALHPWHDAGCPVGAPTQLARRALPKRALRFDAWRALLEGRAVEEGDSTAIEKEGS
jgi:hypothetical protein